MRVLVVEDDLELAQALVEVLTEEGHAVSHAEDATRALALLEGDAFDLVLTDLRLPDSQGAGLLSRAKRAAPNAHVVLMTAFAEVHEAVTALKQGAVDYLLKPFDNGELLKCVRRIEFLHPRSAEDRTARRATESIVTTRLVGQSAQMVDVKARIGAVAPSHASVLVTGESGTGKELVAREIHERSARAHGPFVAVNCAAFPATLIEAELFGFERGAFTGADRPREGRIRAASGGTLFLDEIGELPLPAQAKLLRVLEEGIVEPLGSDVPVRVDVRVASATHRDLRRQIEKGLFREDLFYRINVLDVHLPPLRERADDIGLLVPFFLEGLRRKGGGPASSPPTLSPAAFAALSAYPFPGNVRELAHALEHGSVMCGGGEIRTEHLPAVILEHGGHRLAACEPEAEVGGEVQPLDVARRLFEESHLRKALAASGGARLKAAQMLGISRKTLWEKLRANDDGSRM
jgi:DNA-binding NtrC family response regulator